MGRSLRHLRGAMERSHRTPAARTSPSRDRHPSGRGSLPSLRPTDRHRPDRRTNGARPRAWLRAWLRENSVMRPSPALQVSCPHLEDRDARPGFLLPRKSRPLQITLDGGGTPVIVRICAACATRLGAADGKISSLRLAALTVLHRHLHSRLSNILEGFREIVPLLCTDPDGPYPPQVQSVSSSRVTRSRSRK